MPGDLESRAIALYIKDGGLVCEWHATDNIVRHGYRLLAALAENEKPPGQMARAVNWSKLLAGRQSIKTSLELSRLRLIAPTAD